MYSIYTTNGFVLGSAPKGEASKFYLVYTRDFGLVHASAQGIRLLRSKLRYNIDEFSFGVFSLIKGKEFWRITGVERSDGDISSTGRRMIARVLHLVYRLVQGEEKNYALYNTLDNLVECLRFGAEEDGRSVAAIEGIVLLRILHALGYAGADALWNDLLSGPITNEKVSVAQKHLSLIIREINRALKDSQL